MIKPLWALAGVALLGTAGVAGAFVVASSGGEEEAVQQVDTPTVGAATTITPQAHTPSPSVASTPSPTSSASPVPPGWTQIVQPASSKSQAFSFIHPEGWLVQPFGDANAPGYGLTAVMWSWQEGKPPLGAMKIDASVLPVEGFSSCMPEGSTPASLGGQAAWQKESPPDPSFAGQPHTIRSVATDRGGFRYCFIGFLFDGYDPEVFSRIIGSFKFLES